MPEIPYYPFRLYGGEAQQYKRRYGWVPLEGSPDNAGYRTVMWATPGGDRFGDKVHRIIWKLHHGDIPRGYEIDHINMDKSDNRIENLRLLTHRNNIRAARALKNWGPPSKLTPEQRAQILESPAHDEEIMSATGVSKAYLKNLRSIPGAKPRKSLPADLPFRLLDGKLQRHKTSGEWEDCPGPVARAMYHGGVFSVSAARLIHFLRTGITPSGRPRFLDGNPANLSPENISYPHLTVGGSDLY